MAASTTNSGVSGKKICSRSRTSTRRLTNFGTGHSTTAFLSRKQAQNPQVRNLPRNGLDEAVSRLQSKKFEGYTLALYQKPSLRDGRFANSPWLQEMPDPISKTTWDNYACVSSGTATKLKLTEGQIVKIKKDGQEIELPVLIQPGQSDDCVAVAVGYGRTKAGKAGNGIGANAFPFVGFADETFRYQTANISIEPTPEKVYLAKMQTEDSTHDRPLIEEYSLTDFLNGKHEKKEEELQTLWDAHDFPVHKWGMVIDLGACTGCNACVLSCQAENNIPVVGREEVSRRPRDALAADRPLLRRRKAKKPKPVFSRFHACSAITRHAKACAPCSPPSTVARD